MKAFSRPTAKCGIGRLRLGVSLLEDRRQERLFPTALGGGATVKSIDKWRVTSRAPLQHEKASCDTDSSSSRASPCTLWCRASPPKRVSETYRIGLRLGRSLLPCRLAILQGAEKVRQFVILRSPIATLRVNSGDEGCHADPPTLSVGGEASRQFLQTAEGGQIQGFFSRSAGSE